MTEISNEVKTNKELIEEVVALGFDRTTAESFTKKSQLIAVISSLKSKEEVAEPKKVDSIIEKDNPIEEKNIEKAWKSKAQIMMGIWLSEPMTKMLVPSEPGKQPGRVEWRTDKQGNKFQIALTPEDTIKTIMVNGAKWFVPRGEYVDVPQRVAKRIADELVGLNNAGKQWLIDN